MELIKNTLTTHRQGMYDISEFVHSAIVEGNINNGIIVIYTPHTTCAITINENADPDVMKDVILGLDCISPDRKEYQHSEGNSDAHIKSSLVGASETLIIENGKAVLGTWQGIYLLEFDGPRERTFYIKIIEG